MKALTPEPIDRERAKTDVLYFAKMYLDINLADWQVKLVQSVIDGNNTHFVGGNVRGRQTASRVAIAMARHKGYKVKVEHGKDYIDV